MNIKPLSGYVLVEPLEEELKVGEVYLTETAQDKPMKGKVIAVGRLRISQYEALPLTSVAEYKLFNPEVQEGQIVIYKKWTNQEVKHEGKTYLLIAFSELLGVIE